MKRDTNTVFNIKEIREKYSFYFWGSIVLVFIFLIGVLLIKLSFFMEEGVSKTLIDMVAGALITASLIDFILMFSSQRKNLTNFEEVLIKAENNIIEHIDERDLNQIFDNRLMFLATQCNQVTIGDNYSICNSKGEIEKLCTEYAQQLTNYSMYCTNNNLLILEDYIRRVNISATNSSNNVVKVVTRSRMKYINLSEKDITENFSTQFLIGDGSGNTYKIISV